MEKKWTEDKHFTQEVMQKSDKYMKNARYFPTFIILATMRIKGTCKH